VGCESCTTACLNVLTYMSTDMRLTVWYLRRL
jgi:hypothetical protein